MANAYLTEEAALFCSHYFEPHVHTRHRKVGRNDDGGLETETIPGNLEIFTYLGRPYGKCTRRRLDQQEYMAAHSYILINCSDIENYVSMFVNDLQSRRPRINGAEIDAALRSEFPIWFKQYVETYGDQNPFIVDLAAGPLSMVESYPTYFVNGYKFQSIDYESNKPSTNSGVCLKGTNYADSSLDYYGRLTEVLILEYPRLPIKRVVLFKCDWFDTGRQGTRTNKKYNLVDVNEDRRYNKYDPFILAIQATQVCFVSYPSLRKKKSPWLAVCKVKSRTIVELPMSSGATEADLTAAFQEDEMNRQATPVHADILTEPLNYPVGSFINIDNPSESEQAPLEDDEDDLAEIIEEYEDDDED